MLQNGKSQYEVTTSVNATYHGLILIQMGYVDVSQFVVGMGFNIKGLGLSYDIISSTD
jgi:hypothetical protein